MLDLVKLDHCESGNSSYFQTLLRFYSYFNVDFSNKMIYWQMNGDVSWYWAHSHAIRFINILHSLIGMIRSKSASQQEL